MRARRQHWFGDGREFLQRGRCFGLGTNIWLLGFGVALAQRKSIALGRASNRYRDHTVSHLALDSLGETVCPAAGFSPIQFYVPESEAHRILIPFKFQFKLFSHRASSPITPCKPTAFKRMSCACRIADPRLYAASVFCKFGELPSPRDTAAMAVQPSFQEAFRIVLRQRQSAVGQLF
jgi:hypothetical protein